MIVLCFLHFFAGGNGIGMGEWESDSTGYWNERMGIKTVHGMGEWESLHPSV